MILIYGKNKVGSAVAHLCDHLGLSYDMRDDTDTPVSYDAYEMIIPSPGVPGTHPIYATGRVVCELDFAHQYLPSGSQIVSITGTDGKSTTTWIMYNILHSYFSVKRKVYLSGNFDEAFSTTVLRILESGESDPLIVVEVSSFMSHWIGRGGITAYQSDATIFTNCKPDHLNWHRDIQEYLDAKMNLLSHTRGESFIYEGVYRFAHDMSLRIQQIPLRSVYRVIDTDSLQPGSTDGSTIMSLMGVSYHLSDTHFSGVHNALNILSSLLVAEYFLVPEEVIRSSLRDIHGLPHRLELIGAYGGIQCVEDSKSTSSQSLAAALGSYGEAKNLLLIVGGSEKGDTFDHLASEFSRRVKAMVCIGATKDHFIRIAETTHIPYLSTDTLSHGVEWLYAQRSSGDVLMLSPGCASFGLFRDYLDRANQFRNAIKSLPQ